MSYYYEERICGMRRTVAMRVIIGGLILAVLIAGSVMLGVSFASLDPNEVGLRYNGVAMTIDTKQVYSSGRHFVGLGSKFIVYPSSVQTIQMANGPGSDGYPIGCHSQDGLPMTLEVSFNYRLSVTLQSLLDLYVKFGEMGAVKQGYHRMAASVVRSVAAHYTAFQFSTERSNISSAMLLSLGEQLKPYHAFVDSFQLSNINLPPRFEAARIRQRTAIENAQRAKNDLELAIIDADRNVRSARTQAQTIVVNAHTKANSREIDNEAKIAALKAAFSADAESYLAIQQQLGLTDTELVAYIWLEALKNANSENKVSPLLQLELPPQLRMSS